MREAQRLSSLITRQAITMAPVDFPSPTAMQKSADGSMLERRFQPVTTAPCPTVRHLRTIRISPGCRNAPRAWPMNKARQQLVAASRQNAALFEAQISGALTRRRYIGSLLLSALMLVPAI